MYQQSDKYDLPALLAWTMGLLVVFLYRDIYYVGCANARTPERVEKILENNQSFVVKIRGEFQPGKFELSCFPELPEKGGVDPLPVPRQAGID